MTETAEHKEQHEKIRQFGKSSGETSAAQPRPRPREALPNSSPPPAAPPLVIVAGPTACGKSRAAVQLAKRLFGAVVSADSMQVYRGMDIGSAKVTEEEMEGVPHYLLDCADPSESWNVVRFQREAKAALAQIYAQDRLPILAGGTGFYIQALLYDIDFTAMEEDGAYRAQLEEQAQREGGEALWQLLHTLDPDAAAAIHPHNVKRLIRALEFARQSGGERISEHNAEQRSRPPAYNAAFFVMTMERERLYRRIDERVDRMMEQGLLAETARLRESGLPPNAVSMQGLGYKELYAYLDGRIPSLEEAVRLIKRNTRRFAKRQLTWFKREPEAIWTARESFADEAAMLAFMEEKIHERSIFPHTGSAFQDGNG